MGECLPDRSVDGGVQPVAGIIVNADGLRDKDSVLVEHPPDRGVELAREEEFARAALDRISNVVDDDVEPLGGLFDIGARIAMTHLHPGIVEGAAVP